MAEGGDDGMGSHSVRLLERRLWRVPPRDNVKALKRYNPGVLRPKSRTEYSGRFLAGRPVFWRDNIRKYKSPNVLINTYLTQDIESQKILPLRGKL